MRSNITSIIGAPRINRLSPLHPAHPPLYHKQHYNVRGQLYDVRLSTQSWQTALLRVGAWLRPCRVVSAILSYLSFL
jgi:hypothetical protein